MSSTIGEIIQEYPRVTIYLSNLNCGPYIKDCLNSIVNQSWPNLEILISDDGSTDGSLETIKEYANRDKRIRVFERGKPHGICGAINETLEEATGEFACNFDADDIMMPHFWEVAMMYFSRPEVGFVSIGLISMGRVELNIPIYTYVPPMIWDNPREIFIGNRVFGASPFRMKMFRELGGRHMHSTKYIQYYNDWDFWIRAVVAGWRGGRCVNPLYLYRLREGASSANITKEERLLALEYYKERHKNAMYKYGCKPSPRGSVGIGVKI